MVDLQSVCCMCGDVGFPDKLFRCNKCRHRFQHSYCSSFYSEAAKPIAMCDWCQSEGKNNGNSPKKLGAGGGNCSRSEYSGDRLVKHATAVGKGKTPAGLPSPRSGTRRYKLLKDVMC